MKTAYIETCPACGHKFHTITGSRECEAGVLDDRAKEIRDIWLSTFRTLKGGEVQNGTTLNKEQTDAAHLMALAYRFPDGARVRYIPPHASGDKNHPDCEDGIVSGCNETYVFVRYGGRNGAMATDPEDLYRLP